MDFKEKKYWFYLYPHIYVSYAENQKMLLYNTCDADCLETDSISSIELVKSTCQSGNLGVIMIPEDYAVREDLSFFIRDVVDRGFGNIEEINVNKAKPIVLYPLLKIQKDADKISENYNFLKGDSLLEYINELDIYINTACSLNCQLCGNLYSQTKCCFKSSREETISPLLVKSIFTQIKYTSVKKINILGGDILMYPYWDELLSVFKSFDLDINCWVHIDNTDIRHPVFEDSKIVKHIIVDNPSNYRYLKSSDENRYSYRFFVSSEVELREVNKIVNRDVIEKYEIVPVFTGYNFSFFQKYVFMGKEDILESHVSFREIFCNQKINTNNFGKLILFANGDVKANINTPVIGNVNNNTLWDIVYYELLHNTAWRVVRKQGPCKSCLYQYLCPSPSNYELAIGKTNLCTVK